MKKNLTNKKSKKKLTHRLFVVFGSSVLWFGLRSVGLGTLQRAAKKSSPYLALSLCLAETGKMIARVDRARSQQRITQIWNTFFFKSLSFFRLTRDYLDFSHFRVCRISHYIEQKHGRRSLFGGKVQSVSVCGTLRNRAELWGTLGNCAKLWAAHAKYTHTPRNDEILICEFSVIFLLVWFGRRDTFASIAVGWLTGIRLAVVHNFI